MNYSSHVHVHTEGRLVSCWPPTLVIGRVYEHAPLDLVSEAWGPPQFQGKCSRSEKAILGARGVLGAALGIQRLILSESEIPFSIWHLII